MEENHILWNPIVDAAVFTVDKRSLGNGMAWYKSTTLLLQECFEKDSARLWDAKRRVLLEIFLGWIAALLNLGGAYDEMLCMSSFEGQFLHTGKQGAPQSGYSDFKKLSALTSAPNSSLLQLQNRKRLFCVSRLPAVCFPQYSDEARIGKDTSNKAC